MSDKPIEEVLKIMEEQVKLGHMVFFKYTCEKCGDRVASSTPNSYHQEGYTHEECGHLTKPTVGGILWMSVSPTGFGWEK